MEHIRKEALINVIGSFYARNGVRIQCSYKKSNRQGFPSSDFHLPFLAYSLILKKIKESINKIWIRVDW